MAWNSVCKGTLCPLIFTWKSGVSVLPSTTILSSVPWYSPCEERIPPMPLIRSELGVQGHLVPADFYLEIRGVGLAVDHDLVQRALVLPLRGKNSANALDQI